MVFTNLEQYRKEDTRKDPMVFTNLEQYRKEDTRKDPMVSQILSNIGRKILVKTQ